jgi:murein L,D-transpeptidase YcbB/YkuD
MSIRELASIRWMVLCLTLVGCAGSVGTAAISWSERASHELRARLRGEYMYIGGEGVEVASQLSAFYLHRSDHPAWCTPSGPRVQADRLLQALLQAENDGLAPEEYHYSQIKAALKAWRKPTGPRPGMATIVEIDLLLSNAFLRYGNHLQRGRIDPRRIHEHWAAPYVKGGLGSLLQTALDLNRIREALDGLRPPQLGYARLRAILMEYRAQASTGGWQRVEGRGKVLEARLTVSGDLEAGLTAGEGIERFQRRHGLSASGRIDAETLVALNRPIEDVIAQIELNMERWRWLPHAADARYVLVRLDDYELDVVLAGEKKRTARVIVGKEFWRTPIFSAVMTHLVINPYWYVPRSIAVGEILPLLQRDAGYLQRNGFRVSVGQDLAVVAVDPAEVDWTKVGADEFAYNFAQIPGGANPLGQVKFLFPNLHNIYLHDTPNSALFEREKRAFSHGCIRVEDSVGLAALLLDGWTRSQVEEFVESGQNREFALERPLPVVMLYWTAWVGGDGLLQLREDAYQSDALMRRALARK